MRIRIEPSESFWSSSNLYFLLFLRGPELPTHILAVQFCLIKTIQNCLCASVLAGAVPGFDATLFLVNNILTLLLSGIV